MCDVAAHTGFYTGALIPDHNVKAWGTVGHSSASPVPLTPVLCYLCPPQPILLIQPLMTCHKPTGSTVKGVTEALPSHRPSQRAAAQGKVHGHFTTVPCQWPLCVFAFSHNSFLSSFACQHQDSRGQGTVVEFLTWEGRFTTKLR